MFNIEGKYVVVDGCHRVKAALDEGELEIEVEEQKIADLTNEQLELYKEALIAREDDGIDFDTIPTVASEEERAKKLCRKFPNIAPIDY